VNTRIVRHQGARHGRRITFLRDLGKTNLDTASRDYDSKTSQVQDRSSPGQSERSQHQFELITSRAHFKRRHTQVQRGTYSQRSFEHGSNSRREGDQYSPVTIRSRSAVEFHGGLESFQKPTYTSLLLTLSNSSSVNLVRKLSGGATQTRYRMFEMLVTRVEHSTKNLPPAKSF
jgi:hypothetical protein